MSYTRPLQDVVESEAAIGSFPVFDFSFDDQKIFRPLRRGEGEVGVPVGDLEKGRGAPAKLIQFNCRKGARRPRIISLVGYPGSSSVDSFQS